MKRIITIFLMIISLLLLTTACSNKSGDAKERVEISKIIENRSVQELLNDLYLASDGDIQSLARILNVTPSSIERIRNGETQPTMDFEERVKKASRYFQINSQNYYKLRSELDPEWRAIDTMGHLPKVHPWIFWGIVIGAFALLVFSLVIWFWSLWPVALGIELVFLVLVFLFWISTLIFKPKTMSDPYVDTINPVVEILK